MKKFVINHTQIFVDFISVCFWIEFADKHLRFLQTKHLQCIIELYLEQSMLKTYLCYFQIPAAALEASSMQKPLRKNKSIFYITKVSSSRLSQRHNVLCHIWNWYFFHVIVVSKVALLSFVIHPYNHKYYLLHTYQNWLSHKGLGQQKKGQVHQ